MNNSLLKNKLFYLSLMCLVIVGCDSNIEVIYYLNDSTFEQSYSSFPEELQTFEELKALNYSHVKTPLRLTFLNGKRLNGKDKVDGAFDMNSDFLTLKGITCDVPNGTSPLMVYLHLYDKLYPLTSQLPTADNKKDTKQYDKCGFEGKIRLKDIPRGVHLLSFVVVVENDAFYYMDKLEDTYKNLDKSQLKIRL